MNTDAPSDPGFLSEHVDHTLPMRPAVFLDRDGTINHNVGYLADPSKIELIENAANAVAEINRLGFLTIMVTNQSAIARGLATESEVQRVCAEVALQVATVSGGYFDGIYYCPFHEDYAPDWEEFRNWRKPFPGMFLRAAEEFHIDLKKSWLVGDGMIDHEAAKAAHPETRTIILPSAYHSGEPGPDFFADSLWDAVHIIRQHAALERCSNSPEALS